MKWTMITLSATKIAATQIHLVEKTNPNPPMPWVAQIVTVKPRLRSRRNLHDLICYLRALMCTKLHVQSTMIASISRKGTFPMLMLTRTRM